MNRELIAERDHWKALWRQNTANADDAMRERDQALAENARLTEQLATRTITSDEHLDALPEFTVLRYNYTSRAGLKLHEIWEHLFAGWCCIGGATSPPMGDYGVPPLPAQLIWHPDWEVDQ